jgi:hypothetical protein
MADTVSLEAIKASATALNECGLSTLEDLRLWISKDVDKGIPLLSEASGTGQSLLMALLIAEFCDDAGRSGKPKLGRYWRGLKTFPSVAKLYAIVFAQTWRNKRLGVLREIAGPSWYLLRQLATRHARLWFNWRRHWADALAIIVLPALLVSLGLRVQSARNKRVQLVTVKSSASVPAFQRITDEVELTTVPYMNDTFTSADQVRGRYALGTLPAGSTLLSSQILSAELSNKIQSRAILSLPLKTGNYPRDMLTPCDALLILSAREGVNQSPKVIFEVVLLRIEKYGESSTAIVALEKDDHVKAANLLGSHDAYLGKTAAN